MAVRKYISLMIGNLILLTGCSMTVDHNNKTPLASIGNEYLYREDVVEVMPPGIRGADSVRFVNDYIRNWSEDILLSKQAEENIPASIKIDELVAAYKRSLIIHAYLDELVRQKVGDKITDSEIEQYYSQHAEAFRSSQPYIKGLFVKVPLNAPRLRNVREWYKARKPDDIDKLEKYSIGNAVWSDYFYDQWKPVSELAVKIPLKAIESDIDYLNHNRNVEVKDTAFCYFLHVEQFLPKGEQLPLEYAKREIKEILMNQKRVMFINQMKDDLYKAASEEEKIIYYKE